MADEWHVKWLQEGVSRWNKRRKRVDFEPDLSGVRFFDLLPPDFRDDPKTSRYFEGIDLSGANLRMADLSGMNFAKGKFADADLAGSNLSLSNFTSAKFVRAVLEGANFENSILDRAVFEDSALDGARFGEASVSEAIFISVELQSNQIQELSSSRYEVFSSKANYEASISETTGQSMKRADASSGAPDDKKTSKNKYDVFFGTNRSPVFERGALVGFDGNLNSELSYGLCEVIVPEDHKVGGPKGSIGSRLWKRLRNKSDDRLRIENLIALNQALFFEHLRASSLKMKVRARPTIFVHGFNNSFEDAVLRAAQIGFDLKIGQGIGLFSWPSKGKFLKYSADEASSEASKYMLADFIEQFVAQTDKGGVNIIAHSMGCRCLLGTIEVLSNGRSRVLKSVHQLVLAAADIETAIMPNQGKHAVKYSTRTTSYVSDKDQALRASGWLHSFPRVGVTPPTYVMNGMDTVLVNDLDLGGFSHAYVSTSRTVLTDIFSLLKDNPPTRTSIFPRAYGGRRFGILAN